MSQLPKTKIDQLQDFTKLLISRPETIHDSGLSFFRDYLTSCGATILDEAPVTKSSGKLYEETIYPNQDTTNEHDLEVDEDATIELDMNGVIDPDTDEPQSMGLCDDQEMVELTDGQIERFNCKKSDAMMAFSQGEWQKAIDLFTECVVIDSRHAQVYTKRGTCFLKLNRPNACIRDCDRSIKLNPDSAAAHKYRGRAHQLLGNFVDAAKDLRTACKIDFDEVADEWLKEVTPNAKILEQRERNERRKQQEHEIKQKCDKVEKARLAREKMAKDRASNGNVPTNEMGGLEGLLQDPELFAALQEPDVAAAFKNITANPANVAIYQNNPKVMSLVKRLNEKFGGSGPTSNIPEMQGKQKA